MFYESSLWLVSSRSIYDGIETYWLVPISESVAIVERVAAQHGHESKSQAHQDQEDLEYGQVEFRDSEVLDRGDVQQPIDSSEIRNSPSSPHLRIDQDDYDDYRFDRDCISPEA